MSYRYRLAPTVMQEAVLREHCAHARFVWNLAVEQQSWWRPGRKAAPGCAEQSRQLTEARAEFGWLREGSRIVQKEALQDFAQAMRGFFSGTHRMPGYRKARRNDGFRITDISSNQHVRRLSHRWGQVSIPKIGWVKFRWSRAVPKETKSYRVTLDRAGRWHVSFTALQSPVNREPTGMVIGIDRGVRTALVTSDGQHFRAPRISDRKAERHLALQRRMARQHKGSRGRDKTKLAMARITAQVTDRRKDWCEKVSTRLVIDHDLIVFEQLNTQAMTRKPAPKPDPDRPGAFLPNRRRQKGSLNRGIIGSCWGRLAERATQKAAASGVAVIYVNPRYSSQECRACGHIASSSRESQAVFRCVSCGHADHADTNAARNILARGLALADSCARPGARGVCLHEPAQAAAGTIREAA